MHCNRYSISDFGKYRGLDNLCSYLFPYIYSLWTWSRADRAKLTPPTHVVFAASCEVRARYTDPCTSEGCCQSKFLTAQHSENEQFRKFCFPRQSVANSSQKSFLLPQNTEWLWTRVWVWFSGEIATGHELLLFCVFSRQVWTMKLGFRLQIFQKKERAYIHPKSVSDYFQVFHYFYHCRN